MKKTLLTSIYGLTILTVVGCGADKFVKKGDQFYAIGEYFEAASQYKKAYMHTPLKERGKRGERALKTAECYRRINYTTRAIGAYQNAIRYGISDSTAILHLAQMQHKSGDYKKAEENYRKYLDLVPEDVLAQNGLKGCIYAKQWKENPNDYTVRKEPVLNGRRSDFAPVLFGEEWNQLYITSTRPQAKGSDLSGITGLKNCDIFLAEKNEKGKWTQPKELESDINSPYDEGTCCFSPDGKTMYFTKCMSDPQFPRFAQIFTAKRSDASWGNVQPLEITKDTLVSYAHPAISPDGQWLYFVSDMPGGEGGLDLWRIRLSEDGLGGVENLGKPINTPGNEMFPTFRPNGELYFSSDGHPGMGGLDLFCARKDSNDTWQIKNLQFPMNSSGDDFGMTFEGLNNRGFFSTNRNDARGWDHIMSFEKPDIIYSIKGWVYEKDGYELPDGIVYMVGNDGTNLKLSVRSDGSFIQQIQPNVKYILLGTCKGFLNHKEELEIKASTQSQEHVLQFPLASITAPVLIENVFYKFDSADLTPESTESLDRLIRLLEENPNVTIELSSHCDFRGNDTYNMRLSQRRAESVVNYLINHGISADRLSPVGYGESRPKVIKKKISEKYPFLHENDTLTENYILQLTEEQQEICHALNRRTEFKVLRTTYGLFDEAGKLLEEALKNKED